MFEAPTVIESPIGHTRIALSLSCATEEAEGKEAEDSDDEIDDDDSELNAEEIADDDDSIADEIADDEDFTEDEDDEEIVDDIKLGLFADKFPLPPPHPVTIKQMARLALHME